ncbi:MAG: DMT family transporter [bacterium]|nr:DMT family transporter [bacterium]
MVISAIQSPFHLTPMPNLSPQAKGILLTVVGILALSPDSLLIRLISVDTWTLLFWRGTLLAIGLTVGLLFIHRTRLIEMFKVMGSIGILSGAMIAIGTVFFVLAITHTTVANTLIIIGSSPLFAAVLGRLFLGESIAPRTAVAIVTAFGGIFLTVSHNLQTGSWMGDLFALIASSFVAGEVVVIRFARKVDMTPSVVLGGIFLGVMILPFANPLKVQGPDLGYLGLLGLVVLPVAFGLLTLAPRYLPAPEVSLLKLLEMVVGPYWVWLGLGENPGSRAVLGGTVVILTLVIHSWIGLRQAKNEPNLIV